MRKSDSSILRFGILSLGILVGISTWSAPTPALAEDAAPSDASGGFSKQMEEFLGKDENVEKILAAVGRYQEKKQVEQAKQQAEAAEKEMDDQFKNPIKVDIGNSPTKGKADAKVTVVEFSDFQCPYCEKGAATMEALLKEYPNDVKLVFKNLPLPFHHDAKPAARAALAAKEQGDEKFWAMHDELFKNQRELKEEKFVELAKKIGLDVDKFKADYANAAKYEALIDADMKLAEELGVQGTPGFFVNGVQIRGALPLPQFKKIVDRWLQQGK